MISNNTILLFLLFPDLSQARVHFVLLLTNLNWHMFLTITLCKHKFCQSSHIQITNMYIMQYDHMYINQVL